MYTVTSKWSFFYHFMTMWGKTSVSNFYNNIEIKGIENIPKDKPIIFIANHQCTFMDAVALNVLSPFRYQPAFLTRSDVFTPKIVYFVLNKMKLMPIYRRHDGPDFIEKNERIFNNCKQLLADKKSFIIFVEGSHSDKRRLRILKKGFARMGFDAAKDNNYSLDIEIIPVGLNYTHFTKFKSDFLLNFGKPIKLADYYKRYQENPKKTLNVLKNDAHAKLKQQMIHIPNLERYDLMEDLRTICNPQVVKSMNLKLEKLSHQLEADQNMIERLTALDKTQQEPLDNLIPKVETYTNSLEKLDFRPYLFEEDYATTKGGLFAQIIGLLLLLPFHIYGVLFNYLPYKFIDQIVLKVFKDKMFHSSVKMAFGMFLFPLYYLILCLIFFLIFKNIWWTLLFLASIIICGKLATQYWIRYRKIKANWRFLSFKKTNTQQYENLKKQHKDITTTVLSLMKKKTNTT